MFAAGLVQLGDEPVELPQLDGVIAHSLPRVLYCGGVIRAFERTDAYEITIDAAHRVNAVLSHGTGPRLGCRPISRPLLSAVCVQVN